MTLLDEINEGCPPELLASMDYEEIARVVSQGRSKVVSSLHGIGAVLEVLGLQDGPDFLNKLENLRLINPAVKWGWILLERGELDFGSTTTRAMIDSLVFSEVITEEQAMILKGLAMREDPITEYDVRKALWTDQGVYRA